MKPERLQYIRDQLEKARKSVADMNLQIIKLSPASLVEDLASALPPAFMFILEVERELSLYAKELKNA